MPEGPEVKVICTWLNEYLKDALIVDCPEGYKKKTGYKAIIGYTIEKVTCKGKQLFFHLNKKKDPEDSSGSLRFYLNSRLAFDGKWSSTEEGHTRFHMRLSRVESSFYIYFDDTMNRGGLDLWTPEEYLAKLNKIGPDLLSENVGYDLYKSKIKNGRIRNNFICNYLVKQQYFSGVGNYLRAEILYACKIRPDRKLFELSEQDVVNLYTKSIELIKLAHSCGGLTIKTFWAPDGARGKYTCQVYNKNKDELGNNVQKDKYGKGQGADQYVHWAPNVQV